VQTPWREVIEGDGVTLVLRGPHSLGLGLGAAFGGLVLSTAAREIFGASPLVSGLGGAVVLGLGTLVIRALPPVRVHLDQHLLSVTGRRRQVLASQPVIDIAAFTIAEREFDRSWQLVVRLVDGRQEPLRIFFRGRQEAEMLGARLDDALAEVRTPQGYRE